MDPRDLLSQAIARGSADPNIMAMRAAILRSRHRRREWVPTHRITRPGIDPYLVMLVEGDEGAAGIAYTKPEWAACMTADVEVDAQGGWLHQGNQLEGDVEELLDSAPEGSSRSTRMASR
jgi:hypothetical protein